MNQDAISYLKSQSERERHTVIRQLYPIVISTSVPTNNRVLRIIHFQNLIAGRHLLRLLIRTNMLESRKSQSDASPEFSRFVNGNLVRRQLPKICRFILHRTRRRIPMHQKMLYWELFSGRMCSLRDVDTSFRSSSETPVPILQTL